MSLAPPVVEVDDEQVALLQTEAYDAWAALDDARQTMYDAMDELFAAQEKDRNDGDADAALVAANRAAINAAIKKTQPLSKALIPLYTAADKAQQAADAAAAVAKTAAQKKAGDIVAQNAGKNVNFVGLDLAQVKAYCDITGDDPADILGALAANEIDVGAPPKSVIGASAAVIKANAVNRKSATAISQAKNLHDRIKALNGKPSTPSMKAQGKTLRQQRQALARERNAVKQELRKAIQKGPAPKATDKKTDTPKAPDKKTDLPVAPGFRAPDKKADVPVVPGFRVPDKKADLPVVPPPGTGMRAPDKKADVPLALAPPGTGMRAPDKKADVPLAPPPGKRRRVTPGPGSGMSAPTRFKGQDAMSTSSGYQILGESVTIGNFDIMSLLSGFMGGMGGKKDAAPAATAAQTQMQQMQMMQMQQEAERNRRSAAAAKTTALVIGGVAGLGLLGAVVWKIAR